MKSDGCSRILAEEHLQGIQVVPLREGLKRLASRAVLEITAQHFFQGWFELFDRHAVEYLPPNGLVFAKTAADKNVITLQRFA